MHTIYNLTTAVIYRINCISLLSVFCIPLSVHNKESQILSTEPVLLVLAYQRLKICS